MAYPGAHARQHVPGDEEERDCRARDGGGGGGAVRGGRIEHARRHRARREAHQVGDGEAALLGDALIDG